MNRIKKAFENKKAFIAFITGGDPDIETTEKLILKMADESVDLIEIGIPFSDPVAEGKIIQEADARALSSGTTVDKLFDMVERIRQQSDIPLVFMTYINPIYVYGKNKFLSNCKRVGIDGLIVPDMPFEEKDELEVICEKYEVELISMIAPTSEDRVSMIAKEAKGFLYCVSSLGVTGVRSEISNEIGSLIKKVKSVSDIPCAIGFGISNSQQAKQMLEISDGVIVGSAIVKIVGEYGRECIEPVRKFVRSIVEIK